MEVTNDFFSQNHDRVREFWIRVNRSTKPDADAIGYVGAVEVAYQGLDR